MTRMGSAGNREVRRSVRALKERIGDAYDARPVSPSAFSRFRSLSYPVWDRDLIAAETV